MNENVKHILSTLLNGSKILTLEEVTALTSRFSFDFPNSYLDLIKYINGQEGEIGVDSWLSIFPLQELETINSNYSILLKEIPDYFLFGKDAADTGYAFHKSSGTFHSFGLLSNFKTDSIDFLGNDFYEFLETLYNYRFNDQ